MDLSCKIVSLKNLGFEVHVGFGIDWSPCPVRKCSPDVKQASGTVDVTCKIRDWSAPVWAAGLVLLLRVGAVIYWN